MVKTAADKNLKRPTEAETTVKSSTAESDPKQTEAIEENPQKKLKYLDFVQVVSIYAVVCVSSVYEYAKENSGPLKPGVQTVEETVKTVIGPVYDKFHDVPFKLLEFVDRKVDESLNELERHVPSLVKQASCQARTVASEVQRVGVVDAAKTITRDVYTKCEPTAKEMYDKYEPVAERYAVSAWRSLNRLPFFPQLAHIVVPTAAYWSEKYNQVVYYSGERGYAVAPYLPLIPTDRIAKVFGEGHPVSSNGETVRGK
ncbi:small rubber particle protein2, LD-associated protein 2 [Hibiscus trionum]|uniref:Small rubber particle protein2, LD-associated protein 2 n=1 Tax=Hibiscus trionum TaxID=183268 RepID=A0A9W7MI70_HIBTR|nr:small rubber particle protein2, LD-associated protein 2 [Hibiscus trionum]